MHVCLADMFQNLLFYSRQELVRAGEGRVVHFTGLKVVKRTTVAR